MLNDEVDVGLSSFWIAINLIADGGVEVAFFLVVFLKGIAVLLNDPLVEDAVLFGINFVDELTFLDAFARETDGVDTVLGLDKKGKGYRFRINGISAYRDPVQESSSIQGLD